MVCLPATNGRCSWWPCRLPQACNLYQESKDQRQKLTKCVIVLSVVSFLLLALTLGMMFMVVWALKVDMPCLCRCLASIGSPASH